MSRLNDERNTALKFLIFEMIYGTPAVNECIA